MWDLSSPTRDQTHASCVGSMNLNHWTHQGGPPLISKPCSSSKIILVCRNSVIKFCTKQKYHLYHSGLPWTREANNHTATKWWCEFSWASAFLLVISLPFFINLEITWTWSSPSRECSHFIHFNYHHLTMWLICFAYGY